MSGMNSNFNTSQDPDYVGPTGFEKKFHQDHFTAMSLIDGQEWHIWSDGTKHRFKEARKAARKGGGTNGKKK